MEKLDDAEQNKAGQGARRTYTYCPTVIRSVISSSLTCLIGR